MAMFGQACWLAGIGDRLFLLDGLTTATYLFTRLPFIPGASSSTEILGFLEMTTKSPSDVHVMFVSLSRLI